MAGANLVMESTNPETLAAKSGISKDNNPEFKSKLANKS